MREIPADYDGYDSRYDPQQPNEQRDDYLVRVPRSAMNALERKAKAYDDAMARVDAANQAGTPLEEGEAALGRERQMLGENAPPDQAPAADPYAAAQELHDQIIFKEGRSEKEALGAAFNSLVNAAHQGDRRVILDPTSGRRRGPAGQ